MKIRTLAGFVLAIGLLASCDETTNTLGGTLTDHLDNLSISSETFEVSTRSILADSVLSRNTTAYLGKIKDPETGAYITGDYMSQFHTLENYKFPKLSQMQHLDDAGNALADSCEIRLYYETFYGDSLTAMKLTAYEMQKPMLEDRNYYSNFDPIKEGYIRQDGIKKDKVYSLSDQSVSQKERSAKGYVNNIRIPLNEPYTDKDGKQYNNFGSYIIQQYYKHPEYFSNSLQLLKNVVPGFYFKHTGGLGAMANVSVTQLNVFFRYKNAKDSIYTGTASFAGTEEVLETSTVQHDKSIKALADDNTCTYLKTPAGIFTEMTLPIDEIMNKHANDTVNTAKVTLTRLNNASTGKFELGTPQTLLMIPRDSLYSFFEHNKIADYKMSYMAEYAKATNSYTFNNIGSMVKELYKARQGGKAKTDNWNKVVIIPVAPTYVTLGKTLILSKVAHDMSLTSTRLVGGSANAHSPITINVIYSRFK